MSILKAKANAFLTLVAKGKALEARAEVRAKVRESKFAAEAARERALKVVNENGAEEAEVECAIAWDAHLDLLAAEHDNHISRQQVHAAASEHIRAVETLEDLHAAAQEFAE